MTERRPPQPYELVVRGEISARFGGVFDAMEIRRLSGLTVLSGPVVDQSHLHALIEQIGELGIELVSVNPAGGHPHKEHQ